MNLTYNKSNDMYTICSSINACGESDKLKTSFKITIKTLYIHFRKRSKIVVLIYNL